MSTRPPQSPATSETPKNAESWTVRRILEWTTQHLKKHGSDTPRLDAEVLLAHARNCKRIQLYTDYEEELNDTIRAKMRELVQRRATHEPVAYLVGSKEFFSLAFNVNRHVLIPRPDTETLVMELIEYAKSRGPLHILDVGTGSGCIAISAAMNLPEARFTAVDLSPEALQVARENAEFHKVAKRIAFQEGDLFSSIPADQRFDVIVSNPPYIDPVEIAKLAADVRDHEPRLALDGGEHGLQVYRRLIGESADRLSPGGLLLLEFSPEQAEFLVKQVESTSSFTGVRIHKDLAGRARVLQATRVSD